MNHLPESDGHLQRSEEEQEGQNLIVSKEETAGKDDILELVAKAMPLVDDEATKAISRVNTLRDKVVRALARESGASTSLKSTRNHIDNASIVIEDKISDLAERTKDKFTLVQLKLLGVKDSEQVLDFIHQFKRLKARKGSFFSAGELQQLDQFYRSVADAPINLGQFFEILRSTLHHDVRLTKKGKIYEEDSIKKLIRKPNVLPFLEMARSLVTSEVIDSYIDLSALADINITENFFSPGLIPSLQRINLLLDEKISLVHVAEWADIAQANDLLDIFQLLVERSEQKESKVKNYFHNAENSWLQKLLKIKETGLEKEMLSLLRSGFSEGDLFGRRVSHTIVPADIRKASELFSENPDLIKVVKDASEIFSLYSPFEDQGVENLRLVFERMPEIGPAFAVLSKIGMLTYKDMSAFCLSMQNESTITEYRKVFQTIAEPGFQAFIDACIKNGYQITNVDFFNSSEVSELKYLYRNDSKRVPFLSDTGKALMDYFGIKDAQFSRRNIEFIASLAPVPNALQNLQKLKEDFGYEPDIESRGYSDNFYSEIDQLQELLTDKNFVEVIFQPNTISCADQIKSICGYKISLYEMSLMCQIASDVNSMSALQDPENLLFIKKAIKVDSLSSCSLSILSGLAQCDKTLRPIIEYMVSKFDYIPRFDYIPEPGPNMTERAKDTQNTHQYSVFDNEDIFKQLRDDPSILSMQQQLEDMGLKVNPVVELRNLKTIVENNLFPLFKYFKSSESGLEFVWRHLDLAISLTKLPVEKASEYLEIFREIIDSPSQEIRRLRDSLLDELIKSEHVVEDYKKIESIFIKNNVPTFGKVFDVFKILHNPNHLQAKLNSIASPVLKSESTRARYYTIYQDLLKIHIESGNRSLREYVEIMQSGGKLIDQYEQSGLKSLADREQKQLGYFVRKLETLLSKSTLDSADKALELTDNSDLPMRINRVKESLLVPPGQTILERVSDMYLRPVGLKSLDELLDKMKKSKTSADDRSRQMVHDAKMSSATGEIKLEIAAGDFLKGVDDVYVENILQNGSVAKEFLGASSESDSTPLDTDISLVLPDDEKRGFEAALNASLAHGYGQLLFLLKNRGQYQQTVTGQPAAKQADKWELFKTGVLGDRHYGIRTGFPTTEIDFMIAKESLISDQKKLHKICFEIVQNGFYIPITDASGKVIFTPEMFDEYRKSFAGITKFDGLPLDLHPTTSQMRSFESISQIASAIPKDSERVDRATHCIRDEVQKTLGGLGIKLRPEFDTSILGAELFDTGSTGRHTNTPGDFDFDLSLKLDAKDFPKAADLALAIKKTMSFTNDDSHQEPGGYYQLRVKGVTSINGMPFEKPIDIDIGFASKSDLSVYGSHDAIRDKLNHIKSNFGQERYEQTIANIILTKQILKEGHAYKKQEDGGFGGVGVENWILANGGNMEDAFKSFRDAAYEKGQRIPYEKFKEKYRILDPGTNIKFGGHDNFIAILKPAGYEAMLNTIQAYLG